MLPLLLLFHEPSVKFRFSITHQRLLFWVGHSSAPPSSQILHPRQPWPGWTLDDIVKIIVSGVLRPQHLLRIAAPSGSLHGAVPALGEATTLQPITFLGQAAPPPAAGVPPAATVHLHSPWGSRTQASGWRAAGYSAHRYVLYGARSVFDVLKNNLQSFQILYKFELLSSPEKSEKCCSSDPTPLPGILLS